MPPSAIRRRSMWDSLQIIKPESQRNAPIISVFRRRRHAKVSNPMLIAPNRYSTYARPPNCWALTGLLLHTLYVLQGLLSVRRLGGLLVLGHPGQVTLGLAAGVLDEMGFMQARKGKKKRHGCKRIANGRTKFHLGRSRDGFVSSDMTSEHTASRTQLKRARPMRHACPGSWRVRSYLRGMCTILSRSEPMPCLVCRVLDNLLLGCHLLTVDKPGLCAKHPVRCPNVEYRGI